MQKVGKALRQTRGAIVAAGKLGPMQRRRPLSLRQTLFIGAGLGMLLPALVLSYYQVVSKWDSEINVRVRAPVQQYADVLAHGLAAAIWNVDKAYASELTTAVMQNPDLVSVSVMDEYKAEFVRQEKAAPSGAKLLHEERHIVHNGNRVGSLTLVLTTERVEQELAADLFKLGLALLAQVVISFACIWWLFEQRMMRPLKALLAGAQRLAGGALEQPIRWQRQDEMGTLAMGLESMRGNLAALITERDRHNAALQRELQERKVVEKALSQSRAHLEQRVQERTSELTRALEQLTAAQDELVRAEKMSALGALVAGIAHELNTPLGNSLTVASTIQDHCVAFSRDMAKGLTRSRLEEYVENTRLGAEILVRGLHHAAELVSSFKQVAVDQTSVNRRAFDLAATLNEVLTTLGPSMRKTPHTVECDIPSGIVMDSYPGPLGQVVTNLINNSILHGFESRDHGRIRIQARALPDDWVEIVVADDGVGIAPDHLTKVFDPFFTTKFGRGGSGLGLNIVYNLVTTTLGGRIRVDSVLGEGARFTLTLPRYPDAGM